MFKLKNGKDLKWGTFAMYQYGEHRKILLTDVLHDLCRFIEDLEIIFDIVYIASGKTWDNKEEICEWIDQSGGIYAKNSEFAFFMQYILSTMGVNQSDPIDIPSEPGEKKSL
jgi:hypothetical protein